MKGVKRIFIDIDWNKVKEQYPSVQDSQIHCFKKKWNPFRNDWEQGFDSDCSIHCNQSKSCYAIFENEEVQGENHFKEIIIPTEEKFSWQDEFVEIKDIEE